MSESPGTIRVLHVDDDPGFVDLTVTLLEREGDRIEVETATNPDDGLAALAEDEIDCVVSDYDMPRMDGIEFLQAVRDEDADLPFILFTGKGSEEVASEAISAGVSDYLQKGSGTDQYALLANKITNAVEATRVERERTRQLEAIETAQEGISILDEDGRFVYVNEAYADLYGYDPGEMIGEGWELLYRDEDLSWIREEILPLVRETGHWRGTTTGLRADGSTFVEDHALAITDRGELVCSVRNAEEGHRRKFEETNAVLSTLFDALPQGIIAEDGSGEILTANRRALELLDLAASPEEISGTDSGRLAEKASEMFVDPERFVERIEEVIDEREPVDSERLSLADGRTFTLSYRPIDLPDGEGHLWIYVDSTERTDYQETIEGLQCRTQRLVSLRAEREIAAEAVEIAEETLGFPLSGIHLVDDEGERLEPAAVTDAVREHLGEAPTYEREGASRTTDTFNWAVFEQGEPAVIEDIRDNDRLSVSETPTRSGIIHPLGDHGVFITTSPAPNAFDERDANLVELLATVVTAVLDRTDRETELREQKRLFQEKTERLDEFASVISHDLRNPLNVASARLELLREDCDSEHLDHLERVHDRMEVLIEDLLVLAREGDDAIDPGPVDLGTLVEKCWTTVETADASLDVESEAVVHADESRLKQLFENLVRNAIEHGGGEVTVTVGDLPEGFFVADDGPGIPEKERSRVFETGYSTSRSGIGFGLSIVADIARAHGWDIAATASTEGGARFEITGVDFAS